MKALAYISLVKLEKVVVVKLAGCKLHTESSDKHHMLVRPTSLCYLL